MIGSQERRMVFISRREQQEETAYGCYVRRQVSETKNVCIEVTLSYVMPAVGIHFADQNHTQTPKDTRYIIHFFSKQNSIVRVLKKLKNFSKKQKFPLDYRKVLLYNIDL